MKLWRPRFARTGSARFHNLSTWADSVGTSSLPLEPAWAVVAEPAEAVAPALPHAAEAVPPAEAAVEAERPHAAAEQPHAMVEAEAA